MKERSKGHFIILSLIPLTYRVACVVHEIVDPHTGFREALAVAYNLLVIRNVSTDVRAYVSELARYTVVVVVVVVHGLIGPRTRDLNKTTESTKACLRGIDDAQSAKGTWGQTRA